MRAPYRFNWLNDKTRKKSVDNKNAPVYKEKASEETQTNETDGLHQS